MSQSARSAVFLQEMGIGVQWKLRQGAHEEDAFVTAVQALADGLPEQDAPPAEAPVAVSPPAVPRAPAEAAPRPAAGMPAVVPSAEAVPSAPATPARPAAPAASRPQMQPPAAASDDESTAWFDDAPMPPLAPERPAAAQARPTPSSPSHAPELPPATASAHGEPVSDEAIAAMDWPTLQAAVASCTRCTLCETRRHAVNGRGAEKARWIAISGMPSRADDEQGQAVTGEAGQLLHNMLKAIALQPEADVYITNVVKCRPDDRMPTADEVIACRPYLDRELALTGATMAMTFGQFAARGLMMGPAARGKVMYYGAHQLPVVATYHPDDLLRKPEDKAKAWVDLCLAKASHA
ncbi:uracil-DNA glycosylase family protein [Duganella sp.]|uniref:uracil-DNA glycosylase n=1 Tax=Duganella sp. TaxID=1904440 RepID=UPI0031D4DA87